MSKTDIDTVTNVILNNEYDLHENKKQVSTEPNKKKNKKHNKHRSEERR